MNIKGIDVSLYQGSRYHGKNYDFAAAKRAGAKFVIIKCGEKNYADPDFETNYKAATAAGLDVGAYFVGRAATVNEAKQEAA